MERQEFEVALIKPAGMINAAYFLVPFDVEKMYGTLTPVKVCGTIDGYPYRGSIANMGAGHCMVINKEIREFINKAGGDMVRVVMERDTAPRIVHLPEDFLQALNTNPLAQAFFTRLSYIYKKEYMQWIEQSKKTEIRTSRIRKAIELLAAGRKQR